MSLGTAEHPVASGEGDLARRSWRLPRPKRLWPLLVPLGLLALVAVLAPWLPVPNPNRQSLRARLTPPVWVDGGSWTHPLGTDQLGRDMLARLVYGARLTLIIALAAMIAGAVLGTAVGLVAGYWRGAVDAVLSRLVDAQLALPFVLLAMGILSTTGNSVVWLVIVLAVFGWAQYARVVRAETLSLRERPFIASLRTAGVPSWRIVVYHLLPNVAGTVVVLATLEVGAMILAESALSFLGIGVASPGISWGAMLADGRSYMADSWWVVVFPGAMITIVVLLVNLTGDVLRSRYDPRKRSF